MTFDLSSYSEEQLYDHLRNVITRARKRFGNDSKAGFEFQDANERVNLLGARGFKNGKPVTSTNTEYDDTMFVVYKDASGTKRVRQFDLSTEYGAESGGTALLTLGQHEYVIATHKKTKKVNGETVAREFVPMSSANSYKDVEGKQYRALNPAGSVRILRDSDRDLAKDDSEEYQDNSTINIHYGGEYVSSAKGNWSEGCQIIRQWTEFKAFMALLEADTSVSRRKPYGSNDASLESSGRNVIYTLVEGEYLRPDDYYFPVKLGSTARLSERSVQRYYEHTEKQKRGGYFPLGTNTVWHGGVHVHARKGEDILSVAPGTIIAARLPDAEEKANGHYGSRNFILVKHALPGSGGAERAAEPATNATGYKNTLEVGKALEKELVDKYASQGGYRSTVEGYYTPGQSSSRSVNADAKDQYVCTYYAAEVLKRAGYGVSFGRSSTGAYSGTNDAFDAINISGYPSRYTNLTIDETDTANKKIRVSGLINKDLSDEWCIAFVKNKGIKTITGFDKATGWLTLRSFGNKAPAAGDTINAIRDYKWSKAQNHAQRKGVVKALTDLGEGTEITKAADGSWSTLKKGDFIQYWYKTAGTLGGHVVQVSEIVSSNTVKVHGSHGSTHGITDIEVTLSTKVEVFAVRPNGNEAETTGGGSGEEDSGGGATAEPGKAFYSLYMHLDRLKLDAGNERLKDFPWLREAGGTNPESPGGSGGSGEATHVKSLKPGSIYRLTGGSPVGWYDTGALLKKEGLQSGKRKVSFSPSDPKIHFNGGVSPFSEGLVTTSTSFLQDHTPPAANPQPEPAAAEELLERLRGGGVVKLDVPVRGGDALWAMGEYGSSGHRAPLLHWEIFSEQNLFEDWPTAEDGDGNYNMDCEQILGLVEQEWFGRGDVLSFDEVCGFYETNPKAETLRTTACRFVIEWGIPDVDAAVDDLKAHYFTWGLADRIRPYLWWEEALSAGVEIPESPMVWHYNPIAFMDRIVELAGGEAE